MLVRSAYWIGKPHDGQDEAFRAIVLNELLPVMQTFPGVYAVKSLWPERMEDEPPAIFCQVLVEFTDAAGMAAMKASDARLALRPRVLDAAALFDGRLSHIDFALA